MGKKLTNNIMNSITGLNNQLQNGDNYSVVYIPYEKLKPSKDNFYSVIHDEFLEALADSIANDSLQCPLRIRPIPNTDEYEIISGNRRYEAIGILLKRGDTTYKNVPCSFDNAADDIAAKIHLINANATARVLTDAEKMKQITLLKQLYQEQKKRGIKFKGRTRDRIAETLQISKTQVGRYEAIDKNLIPEFKQDFEQGKISFSTAAELSGLPREKQLEIYNKKPNDEKVKLDDVKDLKKSSSETSETKTNDKENVDESAKPKENKKSSIKTQTQSGVDKMIDIYLKTFFAKNGINIVSVLRYFNDEKFIIEVSQNGKIATYEIKDDKPFKSDLSYDNHFKNIHVDI